MYIAVESLIDALEFNSRDQGTDVCSIKALIEYLKTHGTNITQTLRDISEECSDEDTCEALDELIMFLEEDE